MECPRKGEMKPIIKEKFLFGLHVYMKTPKLPAVTTAGLGKAPFSQLPYSIHTAGGDNSSRLDQKIKKKKFPQVSAQIHEFYRKFRKYVIWYTFYFSKRFPSQVINMEVTIQILTIPY